MIPNIDLTNFFEGVREYVLKNQDDHEFISIYPKEGAKEGERRFDLVFGREVECVDEMQIIDHTTVIDELPRIKMRTFEIRLTDSDVRWLVYIFPVIEGHFEREFRPRLRIEFSHGNIADINELEYLAALFSVMFDGKQLNTIVEGNGHTLVKEE